VIKAVTKWLHNQLEFRVFSRTVSRHKKGEDISKKSSKGHNSQSQKNQIRCNFHSKGQMDVNVLSKHFWTAYRKRYREKMAKKIDMAFCFHYL